MSQQRKPIRSKREDIMLDFQNVTVDGSEMEVMIATPDGPGPHPAFVVAMHIPGHTGLKKDEFTIDAVERLAANGYVSATPFTFHRWPLDMDLDEKRARFDDSEFVADLKAAYQLLIARDDVDSDRIGVLGHCLGGRNAWLAACHNPNYKVIGNFWGGRARIPWGEGNVSPVDMSDRLTCPMIGLFGNDDQNPPPEDVDIYDKALTDAGVVHEFHRYDGAGHAFQNKYMPERYRPEASEDSWKKSLAFFAKYLKAEETETV
jgi:carboxymethylenebutenolidase